MRLKKISNCDHSKDANVIILANHQHSYQFFTRIFNGMLQQYLLELNRLNPGCSEV